MHCHCLGAKLHNSKPSTHNSKPPWMCRGKKWVSPLQACTKYVFCHFRGGLLVTLCRECVIFDARDCGETARFSSMVVLVDSAERLSPINAASLCLASFRITYDWTLMENSVYQFPVSRSKFKLVHFFQ